MHLRIPILGDLHGDMESLAWLSEHAEPDLILQVGDFGYFPGLIEERLRGRNVTPSGRRVPVHWCAGNHECWPLLASLTKPTEVAPAAIYQPTGSTLTLPDGRVALFLGGAKSVDWPLRTEGISVWRDLEIPEIDLTALPERVDVVVSHTLPQSIAMMVLDRMKGTLEILEARGWDMSPDPMEKALEGVLERCKPSLWIASHFHRFAQGVTPEGCHWTALDAVAWWQPALAWLDWLEPYDPDYVATVMVALRRETMDGWS